MEPKLNRKIAQATDDISDVYEKVREYIEDERYLERFDKIMDSLETEQDMEEFFEDVILEYLCDEVAPEGYAFGIHARTGDIGFWKINPKTEDLDLPYTAMPKPPAVRLLNQEDGEPDDEDDQDAEDQEEVDLPEKEGIAEVLDKDGEVVAHTSFRESTPRGDQESLEDEEEEREVG